MKTNTLQNKLKKMQLFFKKSLLFEKIIISLHSDKKSSGFISQFVMLKPENFQKELQNKVRFRRNADLLVCNSGNFSGPQQRIVNPLSNKKK